MIFIKEKEVGKEQEKQELQLQEKYSLIFIKC